MASRLKLPTVAGLLVALATTFVATGLAAPVGDAKVAYSADLIIESEDAVLTGRIHHLPGQGGSPGFDRIELNSNGGLQSILVRPDKQLAWILFASHKAYAVYDLSNARSLVGVMDDELVDLKEEGQETIEGIATRIYSYRGKDRRGNEIAGRVWLTDDEIVMRMNGTETTPERTRSMVMRLENLRFDQLPARLFELPTGWREIRPQQ